MDAILAPLSLARFQALLAGARYQNTAPEADLRPRQMIVTVFDSLNRTSATANITVRPINENPPVLSTNVTLITHVENAGPVSVFAGTPLSLQDADHNSRFLLANATVQVGRPGWSLVTQRLTVLTGSTAVTMTFDPLSSTLLLTGPADVSQFEAVLNTLTFDDLAEEPVPGARAVTVVVNDGAQDSNVVAINVTMALINDQTPVTSSSSNVSVDVAVTFVEEQGEWLALGGPQLSVTDADSGSFPLAWATVQLVDGRDGLAEQLEVALGAPLNWAYNATSYTLTIAAPQGSVADYEATLRRVRYRNTADEPTAPGARSVVFVVSDGQQISAPATAHVTIEYVNDPPQLDLNGAVAADLDHVVAYTEGDNASRLVPPSMTLVDDDDVQLVAVTLQLAPAPDGAHEVLAADALATGIQVHFNATTHTLVLQGPAAVADFALVLATATYENRFAYPGAPTPTLREVTFVADDGRNTSIEATTYVTFASVNDAPILDLSGPAASGKGFATDFTEEGAPVLVVDPQLTLRDVDNATLAAATVVITPLLDAPHELLAVSDAVAATPVTWVFNASTGELRLSGQATVAEYQEVLRHVTYVNELDEPAFEARTVTFRVSDGLAWSVPRRTVVAIATFNDAPSMTIFGGVTEYNISYFEDNVTQVLRNTSLADPDDTRFLRALVTLDFAQDENGEHLYALAAPAGLEAVTGNGSTVLNMTGNLSLPEWKEVLSQVVLVIDDQEPSGAPRRVTARVFDAHGRGSAPVTTWVAVVALNDPPSRTDDYPFDVDTVTLAEDTNVTIDLLRYHADRDDTLVLADMRITAGERHAGAPERHAGVCAHGTLLWA